MDMVNMYLLDYVLVLCLHPPKLNRDTPFCGLEGAMCPESPRKNPLCRFCMAIGPWCATDQATVPPSYASTLVGDPWAEIVECEETFIPSFTTWCGYCERLSFMCPSAFSDCHQEGVMVVYGPPTRQAMQVSMSSFESQVVLWRKLRALSLTHMQ
jgi:hypothetical protein